MKKINTNDFNNINGGFVNMVVTSVVTILSAINMWETHLDRRHRRKQEKADQAALDAAAESLEVNLEDGTESTLVSQSVG